VFNGWVLEMFASGHLQPLRSLTLERTWIGLIRRRKEKAAVNTSAAAASNTAAIVPRKLA